MIARRLLPVLLIVAAAFVLPAAGQEMQRSPRGGRIIEAFLIWRLVDELDLTESQIARIFPGVKGLKTIRIDMGRRMPPLVRELRQLLAQSPRDDEAIRLKVAELNALRAEAGVRRQRQLQMIASALTPEQQAKFVLIQETFEADTLRLLEEVRRIVDEHPPGRR